VTQNSEDTTEMERVHTQPEARRNTQNPISVYELYSRNHESKEDNLKNESSRNRFNNSRTLQCLDDLRRITGGDTGSSNFEENKAFNDSDSDFCPSHLKSYKPNSLFSLLSSPGVTSLEILKSIKAEISRGIKFKQLLALKDTHKESYTILHYISSFGFVSVMTYLLSVYPKLDINVITSTGKTPLHIAIENHKLSMVKFLLHNGASIQVRDNKGRTPYNLLRQHNLAYLVDACQPENAPSTIPSTVSSSGDKR
jgi:ankyrin repeat protein